MSQCLAQNNRYCSHENRNIPICIQKNSRTTTVQPGKTQTIAPRARGTRFCDAYRLRQNVLARLENCEDQVAVNQHPHASQALLKMALRALTHTLSIYVMSRIGGMRCGGLTLFVQAVRNNHEYVQWQTHETVNVSSHIIADNLALQQVHGWKVCADSILDTDE